MDFIKRILNLSKAPQAGSLPNYGSSEEDQIIRWRAALDAYGFPFRIVPHESAMEVFAEEQRLGGQEDYTPVFIVPGLWNSARTTARQRMKEAERQIKCGITAADGQRFLVARFAQLARDLEDDPECPDLALFDALRPIAVEPQKSGLLLLVRYNAAAGAMEPVPEVAIMRIPTRERYTIPLYLDWGGWNAVPSSRDLAAVARYWQETHGASLVAIRSDVLEFTATRKPASHAEAIALLKEQYSFAPDTWEFDQDMLEAAAAELRVNSSWFLWWD